MAGWQLVPTGVRLPFCFCLPPYRSTLPSSPSKHTYIHLPHPRAEATHLHSHWYDRKGLTTAAEQDVVASNRSLEYRMFGLTACTLNLFPVLNLFTNLSNSVGAALWAVELEKRGGLVKKLK